MPRGVNDYDTARIQGRNVSNANSYSIVSPGLVTDGLILHLDAGNFNSYPIAGTTWYNINGNVSNGTLTNGPTFSSDGGGSIVFDGVNDKVTLTSYAYGNAVTLLAFIYPLSVNQLMTIFANGGGGTNSAFRFFLNSFNSNTRNILLEVANGTTTFSASDPARIVYNTWQQVGYVIDKDTLAAQIYYNGSLTVNSTLSIANYNTTAAASIGVITTTDGFPFKGNMGNVLMYNRALTPTEVEQNFNATRARFGV
jgi:hypothetical protein